MFKIALAIAAAAVCAGIVILAPELGPKSAVAATQSGESGALTQRVVAANGRVVRVIAIGRTGNH